MPFLVAIADLTQHSIAPGDARTFVNSTCSASARLVKLYSSYVCDFVLKKNLNVSKPSEHPPQVEECLKV